MLTNHHEYYSAHYFAELLAGDLKETLERWKILADEHPDSDDHREPPARLRSLAQPYFRALEKIRRAPDSLTETQRDFLTTLLPVFDYTLAPAWRALGHGSATVRIPLIGEVTTQSGAPALWIIETLPIGSSDDELSTDPLSLTPLPSQFSADPQNTNPQLPGKPAAADRTWEDILSKDIFGQDEPPRWVIFFSFGQIVLCDRMKWSERRFLSFDLRELFNRREEPALRATAALLHRDSTCPADGLSLLDGLDESSHKHAFEVSGDLKLAVVISIEELANEAVWFIRKERSEGRLRDIPLFREDMTEELEYKLTRDCLRYLYRLLFCFYLEARPELGHLPIKSEEYLTGYSIESLRDLEMIDLATDEMRDGYYFHHSIQTLFHLIYNGRQLSAETNLALKDRDDQSIHDDFTIAALKSHLFDPKGTPILSKVKVRNHILQQILKRLSLTPEKRGRKRGRISYATLGINQLGAVYENLLSYSGKFAVEEWFEVKPADEDHNPLEHAYFVTASELEAYSNQERVYITGGDGHKSLLRHARGKFLYRLAGRARKKSASYYTPESLTRCLVKYALKELIGEHPGDPNWRTADEILQLTVCEMSVGSAAFLNEAINQLAEAYLQRKQKETGINIPHDDYTQERQKVKMFIADNNVFGVDLNPTAVDLAEISLWLNTIYEGAFVPWFGLQLACGNSLIGARRETYPTSLIVRQTTRAAEKPRWPEQPPQPVGWQGVRSQGSGVSGEKEVIASIAPEGLPEISRGSSEERATTPGSNPETIPHPEGVPVAAASASALPPRPSDGIYHWLLGDPGMASYDDKVIKSLAKSHLDRIRDWKSNFITPYEPNDLPELLALSEAADKLMARHLAAAERLRQETTDPLIVWGQSPGGIHSPDRRPTTTQYKDSRHDLITKSYTPHARLKLAMDYWCALWFWPIEQSHLLPTRQQFLTEIGILLGYMPGFKTELAQGYFDEIMESLEEKAEELIQESLNLSEQFVDTDKLCEDPEPDSTKPNTAKRLSLVRAIAGERKFFHWELEFIDLFARRGGFDLILGNPPWVKVEWNEGDLLSEKNPHIAIRDYKAPETRKWAEQNGILDDPTQRAAYFSEYIEFAGTQAFLNASQNYQLLKGTATNLYKCFVTRSWEILRKQGAAGFLHPDGIYDDPKAGNLRRSLYQRLRWHFQFQNELKLFTEVHHDCESFSINVYHTPRSDIAFTHIANLFSVASGHIRRRCFSEQISLRMIFKIRLGGFGGLSGGFGRVSKAKPVPRPPAQLPALGGMPFLMLPLP